MNSSNWTDRFPIACSTEHLHELRGQTIGVLASGGLDSSILMAALAELGCQVQPIYIRSELVWEVDEYEALNLFIGELSSPQIFDVVRLSLPADDLYDEHWSLTGEGVPGTLSPDAAVRLPGRNALLAIKAMLWCQLNQVESLALATLSTSPFADASAPFFQHLEALTAYTGSRPVRVLRPFATMTKTEVLQLGKHYPLERTLSCLAPIHGRHCGACNKCEERSRALRLIDIAGSESSSNATHSHVLEHLD